MEQRRTDITPLRKELKGDLDWITMRAMEKDRTRRYKAAIGFALLIQGDYKEAETHIREGLVIREKLLGREHIQVAPSIENLTRSALSISQNALGDSHNFSTVYLMNLARLKLHLRDYDEARGLYREVLKKYQQGSDRQRMLIPRILRRLAKISKIREEHEQAEELLREALTELSEQGRSKTTQYAGTLFEIAELLSRKGKKDEAKKLYSDAFKVQRR